MIGWELRKKSTKMAQISPGEGLSEGLRGLMENSGDLGRESARDSGELRGELRNSGNSDHSIWRTQGGTQGAPPLGPKRASDRLARELTYFVALTEHGPWDGGQEGQQTVN